MSKQRPGDVENELRSNVILKFLLKRFLLIHIRVRNSQITVLFFVHRILCGIFTSKFSFSSISRKFIRLLCVYAFLFSIHHRSNRHDTCPLTVIHAITNDPEWFSNLRRSYNLKKKKQKNFVYSFHEDTMKNSNAIQMFIKRTFVCRSYSSTNTLLFVST